MSRIGYRLALVLFLALFSSASLLARNVNNNNYWYQPRYMAKVEDAASLLKFLAPHFTSIFEVPAELKNQTITLNSFTASSLGINLFFTVTGETEKDAPGLLNFDTIKVPYKEDEVVSIVYANISSFELENFGDPSFWCAVAINSRSNDTGYVDETDLCVPSRENAEQLVNALATLMGANGIAPGINSGVLTTPMTKKELHKHPEWTGCDVDAVAVGSPAAQAGIQQDDILHTVNGATCTSSGLASTATDAAGNPNGGVVHMGILRKGNPMQVDVHYPHFKLDPTALHHQTASPARAHALPSSKVPSSAAAVPAFHLGISARAVTDSDLAATGLSKPQGVIVTHVEKGSLADQMQLQPGDVILQMNGANVTDTAAFAQSVRSGAARSFRVWRKGKTLDLSIPQSM